MDRHYYYIKDNLGSTVAVVDDDGGNQKDGYFGFRLLNVKRPYKPESYLWRVNGADCLEFVWKVGI